MTHTTIKVDKKTTDKLKNLKIVRKESYEEVILRLIEKENGKKMQKMW